MKRAVSHHLNRSLVVYWHFPLDWVVYHVFPVGFSFLSRTHTDTHSDTEQLDKVKNGFPLGSKCLSPRHKKRFSRIYF